MIQILPPKLTSAFSKAFLKVQHFSDGALFSLLRRRGKSGSIAVERLIRSGPNHVHAFINHADGSFTDLGVSKNLLTNIGRDWMSAAHLGFAPAGGVGSPATAVGATSFTATGTPWTASNLGTPQLGLAGMRAWFPVTSVATAPVYGNIVSNTTSVATIDQWWTAADGVGTTPANTNAFILGNGGMACARFMALTTDAAAASATDTALPSEITTGGCGRAKGTVAHTMGQATSIISVVFTVTSTFNSIKKMGLFTALTSAGADPLIYETVLNLPAIVGNGDVMTCTDTLTFSG